MEEAAEEWLFRLMKRSQSDREKSYISTFHTPEYLASTSRFWGNRGEGVELSRETQS